jgi:RNA polymerase sigma-70 factor (ECF subfamily)
MTSVPSPQPWFAPTRWSLVQRAQDGTDAGRLALAELCEAYWQPVFRVLCRDGRSEDAARELTQEFFAFVLVGNRIAGAEPGKGKFRSYLLGALRHFESDQRKRDRRQKRGGGVTPESLESQPEGADAATGWDERQFDQDWALAVLSRAMEVVSKDYGDGGRSQHFERLRPSLAGGELPPHADLARELGMTEGALKVAIHRLRRRFRDAVCQEIMQTLPAGADLEEELRYLISVWVAAP